MSITDKELLTFCNLANLEMEYANIIKERKSIAVYNDKGEKTGDKELIINHTIYSLLKFEERSKNNFKKLREYYEIEEKDKYIEVPEYSIKKLLDNNKQPLTKTSAKKIAEYVKTNAMMKEKRSNPELYIGSFYEIGKNKQKYNIYSKMSNLRIQAPILMEYYDRYNISKDKSNHEGKFLEEWEVIGAYDKYNLVKELYDNIQKSFSTNKEFLTREEIKGKQKSEFNMKIINISYTIGANTIDCSSLFEFPIFKDTKLIKWISPKCRMDDLMEIAVNSAYGKKIQSSIDKVVDVLSNTNCGKKIQSSTKLLDKKVLKETVKGTPGVLILATGNNDTFDKEFLQKIEENISLSDINQGNIFSKLDKSYIDLKNLFNFSYNNKEDDFKVVILRKKLEDKDEIVVSISKKYFEDLNYKLNQSELPKNMKYILQLINKIQYEYETEQKKYNLTLTGIDEAAKIANILATLVGCNVKGFFTNEPKNIPISLDFSEIDLGFFSENLNYFPDILTKTLSEGAEFEGGTGALENILKEGSAYASLIFVRGATLFNPYFFIIYSSFLLYKYFKNFITLNKKNYKLNRLFSRLREAKIIKNELIPEVKNEIIGNYCIRKENIIYFKNNEIIGEIDLEMKEALKNNEAFILKNGESLNLYLMKIICENSENLELIYKNNNKIYFFNNENHDLIIIDSLKGFKTYSRRKYWTLEKRVYEKDSFCQVIQEVKVSVECAPTTIVDAHPEKLGLDPIKNRKKIFDSIKPNKNIYYEDENLTQPIDINKLPHPTLDLKKSLLEEIKNINFDTKYKGKYYIENPDTMKEIVSNYYQLINALIFYGTFQESFKKRVTEGKSYGAYIKDDTLIAEKKYSLEKNLEYIKSKNEYIFFPFIQKDGNLKNDIRDEYIKTVIRSFPITVNKEFYKWNIDLNSKSDEIISRIVDKNIIISNIKKLNFELKERVIDIIEQKGVDRYKNISEDLFRFLVLVKFGIMKEDTEYDREKIGYIYNDDDLKGKLLVISSDEIKNNEIDEQFVYNGWKIKCSGGNEEEVEIKVTSQNIVAYNKDGDNYYATEKDCKATENIPAFKSCSKCQDGKCKIENIEGVWKNNSNTTMIIKSAAVLSSKSTMECKLGGILKFVDTKGTVGKSKS